MAQVQNCSVMNALLGDSIRRCEQTKKQLTVAMREVKRLQAEKQRNLPQKKLEREMQDGTASEETKAKIAEIEREAALKADSSLHIDTWIRTTSTLLENLKKDTDDLRFQKAYAEILKD